MLNGQDVMDQAAVTCGVKARRHSSWPLALLASTALVAVPPALAPFGVDFTAFADGGAGGYGDRSFGTQPGGVGGTTNPTGAGGAGGDSSTGSSGPGGGGAGTVGGAGGNANSATVPKGTQKGGTGGSHGAVLAADPTQAYTGTDGGDGNPADLGSGGGGAGGFGLVLSGGTGPYTVGYDAIGGKGGKGGDNKMYDTGAGGDGGIGLYIDGTGHSVTISDNVTITGGAGGTHGSSIAAIRNGGRDGADGVGGYGIYGKNLTLTLGSGVTVTGGLAGDGTTRSPAIYFAAGSVSDNSVIIKDDTQTLTGGVDVASGAAYTLSLTGPGSTFDSSKLAPAATFGKAAAVDINSTGTWVITGTDGAGLAFNGRPKYGTATLSGGTLQLGDANGIGALYGSVVIGHDTILTHGSGVGASRSGSYVAGSVGDLGFGPASGSGQKMGTLVVDQIQNQTSLEVQGTLQLADANGKAGNIVLNLKAPTSTALISARYLDTNPSAVTALTIKDAGGLDEGVYRLVSSYSTTANVTNSTLTIGSAPQGLNYALNILPYGSGVELKVFDEGQYWNGTTTSGAGPVAGGNGTWRVSAPADVIWADATGANHFGRDATQTAVFSGTAGTVTVDTTNGAVKAKNLTFLTSGYEISGGTLTLDNIYNRTPKITVTGSGTTAAISSVLAGSQGFSKFGDGTLVLTGANTYTGGTKISAGTLQIGNGGTSGLLPGDAEVDGTLVFNRSDDIVFDKSITGGGTIIKTGANTLMLKGSTTSSKTILGPSQIEITSGTLAMDGAAIGQLTTPLVFTNVVIDQGATLQTDPNRTRGISTIGGTLDLSQGGTLNLYSGYSNFYFYDGLKTGSKTVLNLHLAAPGGTMINIDGQNFLNELSGTINITPESGFGVGTYIIADGDSPGYQLKGIAIGNAPADYGYSLHGDVGYASGNPQFRLYVSPAAYWNGSTTTGAGAVVGGAGTWDVAAATTNWTDSTGAAAAAYAQNASVVFAGTAGTVTVSGSTAPEVVGMKFLTSGYLVTGGEIKLAATTGQTNADFNVQDPGLANGGTATIASVLSGTLELDKSGLGTLILTGANTYSGGTSVNAGTLQLGDGAASGGISGDVSVYGNLVFNHSDSVTFPGVISGNGTLEQKGTGTLVLTGANTLTGTTTVSAGTLQLSGGGSLGGGVTVTSGGTLTGDPTGASVGTIGDAVSIGSGARLALISGQTTLGISGNLVLASGSTTALTLLAPSSTAAATVGGDLTLGGTLNLAAGSGFASGTYRLFNYTGIVSGSLALGTLPAHSLAAIDAASVYQQVNLIVATGQWWNGGGSLGGSGTWDPSAGTTNWSDSTGANPAAWGQNSLAIFGGTAGTVTVGGTTAPQVVGMEFLTTGYTVTGNGIELVGFNGNPTTAIKVEDSAATGGGTATIASVLSGTQGLDKTGTGTLVLTGANTYSGGTTISAGTLQIGDGGTAGSVVGDIVDNGALVFNRSDAVTFAGVISGTGTLDKQGAGTLALTGVSTFTGGTTVTAGTLQLSGGASLAGDVDVLSGATLAGDPAGAGTSSVGANVTVRGGGTLAAVSGASAVSVTIGGNLGLASGATTAIALETPSNGNAAFAVSGNLGLDGTVNLTAGSAFNSGTYRLFDYTGTLSGAGLTLGTTPAHSLFAVDTATNHQVNLAVAAGLWWNGSTTTAGGSSVQGGAGTWDGTGATTNWTNAAGSSANGWGQGSLGIFGGTAGTVTVATTTVPQAAGLEFVTSGYTLSGGEIALSSFHGNTTTRILVEDTSATGGGTATIASVLSGSQMLEKTGTGTLVLSDANTYSGGTTITAGTLQIGSGGTAGEVVGDITNNAALAFKRSDSVTYAGVISGTGSLEQKGSGTLTLTGVNTYSGGTTVSAGTLQIGNGGTSGSITGAIVNNGAVIFNRSDAATYAGVISGTGSLEQTGAGTLTLTGNNTYGGTTTISAGTLQIGTGGTSGTAGSGAITNNAALIFDRSDSVTFAGAISGSGTVEQKGTGTLILTGHGTGTGTTTVSAGTLQLSGGGYIGGDVNVSSGAVLIGDPTGAAYGTIVGVTTIGNGATLRGISGAATLAFSSNLIFSSTSTLDMTLHAPSNTGAFAVDLNLTLGGTLNLTAGANYASGSFRLFDYLGTLSGSMALGTTPAHSLFAIDTSTNNQVNLMVAAGQWWNGGGSLGGSGTWSPSAGTTNWSDSSGATPAAWGQKSLAIFGGTAGTVTVGGTTAPQPVGMEFLTTGYTVAGNGIALASFNGSPTTAIKVEDSAATGGGTATIASVLSGTQGLDKTGTGTLVLTGANTYSGGTTVLAGTLQVSGGGSVAGALTVFSGAALSGDPTGATAGTVSGAATIASGASLQGVSGKTTLSFSNDLTLGTTANVAILLKAPSTTAAFAVGGNLALAGTLDLAAGAGFGSGTYRLFDYTGSLTGSLALGTTPAHSLAVISTATNNQVNLAVAIGQWWNGGGSLGGSGTWDPSAGTTNWSDSSGANPAAWGQNSLAIFGGTAGTVTVGGTTAPQVVGMEFLTTGYTVTGNGIELVGFNGNPTTAIKVEDSAATGGGTATIASVLSGTQGLDKTGTGTLVLTGANTYSGGTTISAGTLQIGDGGTAGSVVGDIVDNGALVFNRSDAVTFAGVISGTGTLDKQGAGTLALTGVSTFTGGTTVTAGTLQLSGGSSLAGDVDVLSGATLAGDPAGTSAGSVGANVTVHNGGTLAAVSGASAVGISIGGNLSLASGATTAITLETPSNGKAAFGVAGNLGLDGTVDLAAGAAFNSGTYRLFDYAGTLSGGGLTLGTTPAHSLFAVDTATNHQVNLAVAAGLWWNGSTTTAGGSSVQGGAGTWDGAGSTTNWTNAAGSSANGWGQGSLGIFAGTAGTVTVATATAPQVAGLEFVTSGYTLSGGEIALSSFHGNTVSRVLVDDGTAAGGSATIASVLSGAQTFEKIGVGTLVLTGTNTYSGGTKLTAGTLQIGDGGTSGAVVGDITDNAALAFKRSDSVTYAGAISGTGSLAQAGSGRLILTGTNTYTGGTTVGAGTLQVGAGGTKGSLAGAIANSGTLVFDRSDSVTLGGAITGTGALFQHGAGTLALTGSNSAGAGTTVAAGTLALADGVQLSSDVIVQSGATLAATGTTSGAGIAGIVTVQGGGTLSAAPTAGGAGLSTTGLVLAHTAHLAVTLGANAGIAAISTGTLSLDGVLDVSNGGTLMQGIYRVIDYATLASDNGLQLGTTPANFTYQVQRQTGQVNLAVAGTTTSGNTGGGTNTGGGSGNTGGANTGGGSGSTGGGANTGGGSGNTGGASLAFWNGSQANPNGLVQGGSGTWRNDPTLTNWTNATANQALPWSGAYAVFTASPGTVTVDAANGPVAITGAQFATDGYLVTGGGITLAGPSGQTQIRVGDGTAAGANMVARVYSAIGGLAGLEKVDLGTLILGPGNTYAGGTTIAAGVIQIDSASALGTGALALQGGGTLRVSGGSPTDGRSPSLRSTAKAEVALPSMPTRRWC